MVDAQGIVLDNFDDCIFTDECTVQLFPNTSLCFSNKQAGVERCPKPTVKHPTKVHVWSRISARGATRVLVFEGRMEARFYVDTILTNGLTPFVRRVYPGRHRFVQDDPKYTLRIAQQYMADNNINWWRTPPESPDLNPIEMVWSALKRNLEREGKPRNKVQLIDCIKDFWRQHLTPQVCRNYIGHFKKVVPVVVEKGGKASRI